jgi:calcium-dependent protein kinase
MEFCAGGELVDKIKEVNRLTEKETNNIIWKLISAISYCHSKGISHRDLKPENILFAESSFLVSEISIIDFNLSKDDIKNNMKSVLGTPFYMAPEVILGDYDEKCDIWAIGIIAYFMLCGQPPYDGNSIFNVYNRILNDEIHFKGEIWETISDEAKDFIKSCLCKDAKNRPSGKDLLKNNWFNSLRKSFVDNQCLVTLSEKLNNLKNFTYEHKFKKLVLKCILENVISPCEIKRLRNIFFHMDLDHTGYIDIKELQIAFDRTEIKISEDELLKIVEKCDDRLNGKLDYTEFLLGSMDHNYYVNKIILKYVFDQLDIDKSGNICQEDLRKFFVRSGQCSKPIEEISHMIHDVSKEGKEYITFDEVCSIFNLNETSDDD